MQLVTSDLETYMSHIFTLSGLIEQQWKFMMTDNIGRGGGLPFHLGIPFAFDVNEKLTFESK
jgi:hypothetical protein